MNFKNNPLEDLRRLTEAVKNAGADIAPTYMEYIQMAFAIATDCGEAGRAHFIELCSLSPKFDAAAAHRLFTNTLHSHRDSVHLGAVFHLASLCGVNVPHPLQQTPDDGKIAELQKVAATFSHARACARETAGENTPGSGLPPDDDFPGGESGAETWREGLRTLQPPAHLRPEPPVARCAGAHSLLRHQCPPARRPPAVRHQRTGLHAEPAPALPVQPEVAVALPPDLHRGTPPRERARWPGCAIWWSPSTTR